MAIRTTFKFKRWWALDLILAISELRHEKNYNHYLAFDVEMMLRDAPIKVMIPLEDDEVVFRAAPEQQPEYSWSYMFGVNAGIINKDAGEHWTIPKFTEDGVMVAWARVEAEYLDLIKDWQGGRVGE